jgi:hypothetical protein
MKHFMMSKKQTAAIIFTSFAIQESEIEIFILSLHTHSPPNEKSARENARCSAKCLLKNYGDYSFFRGNKREREMQLQHRETRE